MLVIIVGVFAALWLPQRSGPFYLLHSIQYFLSIRNPKTPTVEVVVGLQYYRRLVRGHHVRGSLVSDVL